ncbi:MAG: signal peptidase I [Oscillospiraceae bacterium]|jgi:signal peptidase I|nr:signal peptidase I [Oscillospiraceae bacterium]
MDDNNTRVGAPGSRALSDADMEVYDSLESKRLVEQLLAEAGIAHPVPADAEVPDAPEVAEVLPKVFGAPAAADEDSLAADALTAYLSALAAAGEATAANEVELTAEVEAAEPMVITPEPLVIAPEPLAAAPELLVAAEKMIAEKLVSEDAAPDAEKRSFSREMYDWIQCIVSTVVLILLLFTFVGRQIGVIGPSMLDTLHDKDRLIITNLFYTPKYGDIIIIKTDFFGDNPIVKRVIATEGQTVDIDFGTHEVKVDGVILNEPYINEPTAKREDFSGPVTVPPGCLFVMGDNRNYSTDSRSETVGFVDTRNVLGKVLLIVLPGTDSFGLRDWSRVGSPYGV